MSYLVPLLAMSHFGTFADARSMLGRTQVYKGSDEVLLSKLILEPTHSILRQSWDARLRLVSRST